MSTPKITNKTISLSRYNNLKVNAAEKQKAMDAVYPFWQMLTKEDQNDILNSCKKFKEKRSGLFGWLNHEKQNNILECLETSINDKLKTLGKENKNLAKSITENLYILMKNEIWIFKSKIPTSLQSLSSNSKLDEKMNYFGVKSFTNNRRCEDDIINSKLEDKDFKYIINNLHRFNDRQRNIIVDRLNRNPNLLDPMCDGIISILVVLMSDSKTSGTNLSVEPIVIKALAQDKFNNHPYALENVVNLLEVFKGNNNAQNTIVNMISNVEFARQHPQALEKMVDKLEMFEDNKVAQNTIVDIISDVEFALQHPQALEKVVDKLEIFKNNKVAQNKIVNIISNVEFALQHPQALEKVVDKLEIFKGNNNARNTIVDIISDVEFALQHPEVTDKLLNVISNDEYTDSKVADVIVKITKCDNLGNNHLKLLKTVVSKLGSFVDFVASSNIIESIICDEFVNRYRQVNHEELLLEILDNLGEYNYPAQEICINAIMHDDFIKKYPNIDYHQLLLKTLDNIGENSIGAKVCIDTIMGDDFAKKYSKEKYPQLLSKIVDNLGEIHDDNNQEIIESAMKKNKFGNYLEVVSQIVENFHPDNENLRDFRTIIIVKAINEDMFGKESEVLLRLTTYKNLDIQRAMVEKICAADFNENFPGKLLHGLVDNLELIQDEKVRLVIVNKTITVMQQVNSVNCSDTTLHVEGFKTGRYDEDLQQDLLSALVNKLELIKNKNSCSDILKLITNKNAGLGIIDKILIKSPNKEAKLELLHGLVNKLELIKDEQHRLNIINKTIDIMQQFFHTETDDKKIEEKLSCVLINKLELIKDEKSWSVIVEKILAVDSNKEVQGKLLHGLVDNLELITDEQTQYNIVEKIVTGSYGNLGQLLYALADNLNLLNTKSISLINQLIFNGNFKDQKLRQKVEENLTVFERDHKNNTAVHLEIEKINECIELDHNKVLTMDNISVNQPSITEDFKGLINMEPGACNPRRFAAWFNKNGLDENPKLLLKVAENLAVFNDDRFLSIYEIACAIREGRFGISNRVLLKVAENLSIITNKEVQHVIALAIQGGRFGISNRVLLKVAENLSIFKDNKNAQQIIALAIQGGRFGEDPKVLVEVAKNLAIFTDKNHQNIIVKAILENNLFHKNGQISQNLAISLADSNDKGCEDIKNAIDIIISSENRSMEKLIEISGDNKIELVPNLLKSPFFRTFFLLNLDKYNSNITILLGLTANLKLFTDQNEQVVIQRTIAEAIEKNVFNNNLEALKEIAKNLAIFEDQVAQQTIIRAIFKGKFNQDNDVLEKLVEKFTNQAIGEEYIRKDIRENIKTAFSLCGSEINGMKKLIEVSEKPDGEKLLPSLLEISLFYDFFIKDFQNNEYKSNDTYSLNILLALASNLRLLKANHTKIIAEKILDLNINKKFKGNVQYNEILLKVAEQLWIFENNKDVLKIIAEAIKEGRFTDNKDVLLKVANNLAIFENNKDALKIIAEAIKEGRFTDDTDVLLEVANNLAIFKNNEEALRIIAEAIKDKKLGNDPKILKKVAEQLCIFKNNKSAQIIIAHAIRDTFANIDLKSKLNIALEKNLTNIYEGNPEAGAIIFLAIIEKTILWDGDYSTLIPLLRKNGLLEKSITVGVITTNKINTIGALDILIDKLDDIYDLCDQECIIVNIIVNIKKIHENEQNVVITRLINKIGFSLESEQRSDIIDEIMYQIVYSDYIVRNIITDIINPIMVSRAEFFNSASVNTVEEKLLNLLNINPHDNLSIIINLINSLPRWKDSRVKTEFLRNILNKKYENRGHHIIQVLARYLLYTQNKADLKMITNIIVSCSLEKINEIVNELKLNTIIGAVDNKFIQRLLKEESADINLWANNSDTQKQSILEQFFSGDLDSKANNSDKQDESTPDQDLDWEDINTSDNYKDRQLCCSILANLILINAGKLSEEVLPIIADNLRKFKDKDDQILIAKAICKGAFKLDSKRAEKIDGLNTALMRNIPSLYENNPEAGKILLGAIDNDFLPIDNEDKENLKKQLLKTQYEKKSS